MPQAATRRLALPAVPREFVAIAGFAGATVVVVASGAGLSRLLPQHAEFSLIAGAYAAPAAVAFAIYWWVAQKL